LFNKIFEITCFQIFPLWGGGFDKISQVSLPQGVGEELSMDILKIFVPTFPQGWGVTIDKCIISLGGKEWVHWPGREYNSRKVFFPLK
jgi:hypothetical protein